MSESTISRIGSRIYKPETSWYASYRNFIHRAADKIRLTNHPIVTQLMAETLATAVLMFYADGANAQKFLLKSTFLELCIGNGLAVTQALITGGGKASPAYLNPAVATANTVVGRLRWSLLPLYIIFEVVGAFLGTGLLLAVYNEDLTEYANKFEGGRFLVNTTGGIFATVKNASVQAAAADQIITTALLLIGLLAMSDNHVVKKPSQYGPFLMGMVVYITVTSFNVNAAAALNPAREIGGRLLILAAQWGAEAFTIDSYYFWVPTITPIVGAIVGAIIYELVVGIHADGAGGQNPDGRTEDDDSVLEVDPDPGQTKKIP